LSKKKKKPGAETLATKPKEEGSHHGEDILAWSVVPMKREPQKAKILIGSTLVFLLLVYYVSYWDLMWVIVAALLLVASFSSFLFPARYRLTTKGVEQKAGLSNVFKPWDTFIKAVKYKDGILLSHGRSRLRNRLNPGLFLYFGDNNSEEVLRVVEQYLSGDNQVIIKG